MGGIQTSDSHGMGSRSAARASPGNLLDVWIPRPCPRSAEPGTLEPESSHLCPDACGSLRTAKLRNDLTCTRELLKYNEVG